MTAPHYVSDFDTLCDEYVRFRRPYSPELFDAIAQVAGGPRGRRALDVACGSGLSSVGLSERGWAVTGVDIAPSMLAAARSAAPDGRAAFYTASAEALPFADGAFALLVCGQAFHWFEAERALAEFARVLAPGGALAIFWKYAKDNPFGRAVAGLMSEWTGQKKAPLDVHTAERMAPFWAVTARAGEKRAGAMFVGGERRSLDFPLRYSVDSYIGYHASRENLRLAMGPRREAFLEAARALVARLAPPSGEFEIDHQQVIYLAHKP